MAGIQSRFSKCTPIAFSGNKYASYSNNYVLKNDALLNRFVADLNANERKMMNDLRKEFGVDKKIEGHTEQEKNKIESEKRNREYEKQRKLEEEKKRLEEEAKAKEMIDVKDDLDGMDDRKSEPVIENEKEKANISTGAITHFKSLQRTEQSAIEPLKAIIAIASRERV